MALTDNVNYCGKYSFDFFSPALFDNELFKTFDLIDGVKGKITLPKVSVGVGIQNDSCSFTAGQGVTIDPRILEVCPFKINEELCFEDIEASFLSEQLKNGGDQAETTLNDYILGLYSTSIGNSLQDIAWNGNLNGGTGSTSGITCTGLFSLASGATTVTATGITAANVMTEIGKVYAKIPAEVLDQTTIYVSPSVAAAYRQAQGNVSGGLFMVGAKELNYLGVKMQVAPKMAAGKMFATVPSNVVIGTDLLDEYQSVKLINMYDTTGEAKYRFVGRFKWGIQIRNVNEVVVYA